MVGRFLTSLSPQNCYPVFHFLSNTAIHDLGTMPTSTRHHREKIVFLVQKVEFFNFFNPFSALCKNTSSWVR